MATNYSYWALGHKLKNIRMQNGKTLTDVADAIGFSPQFLSMVEKGKSGISFPNLHKIMSFYGLTIADLVDKGADQKVLRLDQAESLGVNYEGVEALLLYKSEGKIIPQIAYFRLEPGASIGDEGHEGDAFVFVVDGMIEFTLTDPKTGYEEKHVLGKGDSIHNFSNMRNRCVNISNKVSTFTFTIL